MHVRVARFEGIDVSRVEEDYKRFREMVRANERPEFMPREVFETLRDKVRRIASLLDRDAAATLDLTFMDNAEDAQAVHEALDSLTPPEGSGSRTSVQIYELVLDEQL